MANSLTTDTQLGSQMKKTDEKKKEKKKKEKEKKPKIQSELIKFYIANKHRTVTFRKIKLKSPSSDQFKRKK